MSVSTSQVPVSDSRFPDSGPPLSSAAGAAQSPEFAPPPYPIHRFTVTEYEQIARAGILDEDSNVELLEGWIVPKLTKHPPHDGTIDIINYLLRELLPAGWFVRIQNCAITTDSVPEPDLAIVRGEPRDYRRKAKIYAQAGIPHYWIINLDQRQIEVFSRPSAGAPDAVYQSKNILRGDDETLEIILDGAVVGSCRVRDILA